MAIVSKTLSITLTAGAYPNNYMWTSDCPAITYSQQTGTAFNDGVIITDIYYDDSICYECMFTFEFGSDLCYAINDTKNPISLSCGTLSMFNGASTIAQVDILNLGFSCVANGGSTCFIPNVPFGSHTLEINVDCTPQTSNVSVNGVTQNGNGLFVFNTTTTSATPNIDVQINCS